MGQLLMTLVLIEIVILTMENTNEYELGEQAKELIEKCEVDLPRNTECIIIAKEKYNAKSNNEIK